MSLTLNGAIITHLIDVLNQESSTVGDILFHQDGGIYCWKEIENEEEKFIIVLDRAVVVIDLSYQSHHNISLHLTEQVQVLIIKSYVCQLPLSFSRSLSFLSLMDQDVSLVETRGPVVSAEGNKLTFDGTNLLLPLLPFHLIMTNCLLHLGSLSPEVIQTKLSSFRSVSVINSRYHDRKVSLEDKC